MVHLLIAENRNTDPVRFAKNRVRVFVGEDYAHGFWADEDQLFSYLSGEQKRLYLTENRMKPLELTLEEKTVRKIIEVSFVTHKKKEILDAITKTTIN